MPKPPLKKYPAEIFGYPYTNNSAVIENEFPTIADNETILWASEVSIGIAGSIDFVAVRAKKLETGYEIQGDFVCVELQAAGTTGTPWQAVLEHKEQGKFLSNTYNYGINWANEFAKTMMQQAYKKGMVVEHWGKKVIFAMQDIGLEYLERFYDTSDLREARTSDPVHFYLFKMFWNEKNNA